MKYKPSLPEHNDNVTHEKPVREFLMIFAGLGLVGVLAFWGLGLLVDLGVDHMGPETEARINRAVAFKMEQEKPFAPEKRARLQKIVDELRECAAIPYPVTVTMTESRQPNAAVFPGGHIMVFSALLDKVRSENGIAFVLAHELSHLMNRDHLRAMGRGVLLAAVSAALTGSNSDVTQIFVPLNRMGMARHSQGREMQADARALQILHCRFGHAGGATEFFEAMKSDAQADGEGYSHYFASHPQLQERIDNINRMIGEKGMKLGPVTPFQKLDR